VLEIVLFAVSSLLLYHLGFGFFLFLIPFQVLAVRRDAGSMYASQALAVAALAVIRLVTLLRATAGEGSWLMSGVEIAVFSVLLLALAIVNLPILAGHRAVYRLLAAAGTAAALFVPLILVLSRSRLFLQEMEGLFTAASKSMRAILAGPDNPATPWIADLLEPGPLMRMCGEYVQRSFLPDALALVGFSWWAGTVSGRKSMGRPSAAATPRLASYRLPSFFVWPFIVSWAAIAADLFLGIAAFGYAAWNLGLAMLLLYGMQGLAIFRFLFEKHHIRRGWWILLMVGLGILLASPRLNIVFLFGIPLLGVSEQWITYRIPERSERS
jgi:hypothetical protein